MLLDEALRKTAERDPDVPAWIDASRADPAVTTYAEYERAAAGLAAGLGEFGVGRGDVVCVHLGASAEYAIAYMAAARLGAIMSGVNTRLGAREFAAIVAQAEPRVLILEDDDPVPAAPKGTVGPARVVRRHELAGLCDLEPVAPVSGRSEGDAVAIVWTSGTTGAPKGATYTHACLSAIADVGDIICARRDVYLAAVPFAHVGFSTKLLEHTLLATTHVITPLPWKAANSLRLIEEHRVTVAGGIPAQWRLMLDSPEFESTDLSSVERIVLGGAFIEPDLVRELRERVDAPVVARYSTTEIAIGTGTGLDDGDEVVANTVGKPIDGVEVRIGSDTVGEIQVRSRAMMHGYWRAPELTAAAIDADGWYATGDLGTWDANGNLRIVGRIKDMYIRGGYNVYPAEVEARLAEHSAIAAAGVVGIPDAVLGETGVAFVVVASGKAMPTRDELRAWVAESLADYKRPDRFVETGELPLTSMHKPDKAALRQRAEALTL